MIDCFEILCMAIKLLYKIEREELIGEKRIKSLNECRYCCYRIMREQGWSLIAIGKCFGGRDHSTVIHGLQSFEDFIETDKNFEIKFNRIKNLFESEVRKILSDLKIIKMINPEQINMVP